ncbi:DksA/TraR family C4-type zinc finger protein [Paracoccus seriniphilus]|uniref:DksA/TraR family C4-type zinc finger protein n=1 Tax=Paracoccus seriniphilus TaxID=184748 RepID=UPI003567996B
MAGGWARDDAVNEQIEISTAEAIARARLRSAAPARPSAEFCRECDEPIPEPRRIAMPGVQLCIECQSGHDRAGRKTGGLNRRASKDSLLK